VAESFSAAGRATVEAGYGSSRSAETIVRALQAHAGMRETPSEASALGNP
jgi:hypothetical protein